MKTNFVTKVTSNDIKLGFVNTLILNLALIEEKIAVNISSKTTLREK